MWRSVSIACLLPVLVSLQSCFAPDATELCSGKYENRINEVASRLKTHFNRLENGRSVAALDRPPTGDPDASNERVWEDWAHDNLVEIQRILDDVNSMEVPESQGGRERLSQLRSELSRSADELVQIFGLFHEDSSKPQELGQLRARTHAILAAFDRLERSSTRARGLACGN